MPTEKRNFMFYLPLIIAAGSVLSGIAGAVWTFSEMRSELKLNNTIQDARITALEVNDKRAEEQNLRFQDHVIKQLDKINDKLNHK
jgi:hypothetical protein